MPVNFKDFMDCMYIQIIVLLRW